MVIEAGVGDLSEAVYLAVASVAEAGVAAVAEAALAASVEAASEVVEPAVAGRNTKVV